MNDPTATPGLDLNSFVDQGSAPVTDDNQPMADEVSTPPAPIHDGLYPKLDPQDVLAQFQRRANASLSHSKDWRTEAKTMYDFMAGRQWDQDDEARMEEANRPMVTFNLMSKFIDVVTGLQINNRQDIRCFPRTQGKVGVSDVATGALAWCRDQCGAEFEETDAGQDCLLHGMGWMEEFYDDISDPDGIVAQERRDPMEMLWDPMARKKNLVDRRWQIRIKRCSEDEYEELFGKKPTGSIAVAGLDATDLDMGIQVVDKPQDYTGDSDSSLEARGKFLVADYQFMCLHTIHDVTATYPGKAPAKAQFSAAEWPATQEAMKAGNIPHQMEPRKVRVYYRCWITSEGVHNESIPQIEAFTFHAITGKRDRNKNLWFGLGRNLKDPQRWVNAFFSSIIWQLMVNAKGGIMMEEDAVDDQAAFEDSWADPSKVSFVASGAITGGKYAEKPGGKYPDGMDRLMNFSMEALPGVTGLNTEILGMTDRDQAGVVEAQRKQGALSIVAWYFDALRRYYKESGVNMLGMIRNFMSDGRLIRIVGQDGAQYVPLLKDKMTGKFDLIVDEAPTSVNMQERVWAVLKETIPMALQAGIHVPPEVLDYAPLPEDLRQKWKSMLTQPQQPDPQAQQAAAAAAAAVAAKTARDNAAATKDTSQAHLFDVEAATGIAAAPQKAQLMHVETLEKAAKAGAMQAGQTP